MITAIFSTYAAGFLTSLTPCVYPMIPLSLGYLGAQKNDLKKKIIFSFSLGQIFTFTMMGLVAVQLGEVFGFLSQNTFIQFGLGGLLIVFSYYAWNEKLPGFLLKLNKIQNQKIEIEKKEKSILTSFLAGAFSALVASPCSTPVLGGVLVMISQSESKASGMFLMFMYGLGLSTLFLVLGLGLFKLKALPRAGMWMQKIHKISVALLFLSGLYFIYKAVAG